MGFWGIEVKPGKPYPYHSDNVRGTLHITQATLGLGSSKERSIVQCSVGHKKPIFLCALLPNKNESCPLDLEFDEDDLVAFSVIGPQSVHLSGCFVADEKEFVRDDYESDSLGEDIADTETDSSEYNTNDDYGEDDEESEDGFFVRDDNDYDMYQPSNVPKSGVVIEEIVDNDKPNRDDQTKRSKKKKPSSGSLEDTNSQHQIVVRRDASITIMESEDEDGFPISITQKSESDLKFCVDAQQTDNKTTVKPKKIAKNNDSASNSKRKVENVDEDGEPDSQNKKKKKKKKKKHLEEQVKENTDQKQPEENEVVKMDEPDHKSSNEKTTDVEMDTTPIESQPENKKKKKHKKKTDQENFAVTNVEKSVTSSEQQSRSTLQSEQQQTEAKASKTRTFPNGLVVEEVEMGKPDGKRASPGKQVSVCYIGKLKNGKIFDSNVRGPPFKFRLGLGQVIAGWDVGVDGMRVGDKRRLTIPPSMGYGSKGAGGKIPPNSWLVFDVELIDVR